ncbi:hypothetical protein J7E62_15390 [Variovorax paradoxus]|nr:hypothetical protein [Variovorax paradoxus]
MDRSCASLARVDCNIDSAHFGLELAVWRRANWLVARLDRRLCCNPSGMQLRDSLLRRQRSSHFCFGSDELVRKLSVAMGCGERPVLSAASKNFANLDA